MVIYLDVLLLENFIVNLFLLHITAQAIKLRSNLKYLILASLFGSMYVVTLVYPSLLFFSKFIFKLIIATIMILISFRKKNFLFNLKALIVLILYTMLLAGFCIFLDFNFNGAGIVSCTIKANYRLLLSSIMFLYILVYRIIVYVSDRKEMNTYIYLVDIVLKNKVQSVQAFLDTGNELREPATNLPVMIVEKHIFQQLTENIKERFYIPYSVVNGHTGNLEGFKPEYIQIHCNDTLKQVQAIIACCENKLSDIEDYQALLSRGII